MGHPLPRIGTWAIRHSEEATYGTNPNANTNANTNPDTNTNLNTNTDSGRASVRIVEPMEPGSFN